MSSESFFWHDYETFGRNPHWYCASQFAGIRTDMDLNIIEEPVNVFCQPSLDTLPEPEACLITGITPQLCLQKGVSEASFAKVVYQALSKPGTCGVGYNSIRFDDNFTRNIFYRNFFPVYDREWKNGNSRWDLIDVMRMARALRPDGIVWPDKPDGAPSFTLENLASVNGLLHDSAHDALSDVLATIELAKLLKKKQPRFFDYAFSLRKKYCVSAYVDPIGMKPFFHVSSRLKPEHLYSSIMMPLAVLPNQSSSVICFDLMHNPKMLLEASVDEVRQRVFTAQADLPDGVDRVALKQVSINRSPMVADVNVVDDRLAQRLQLDKGLCERHWQLLLQHREEISQKVVEVMSQPYSPESSDIDCQIYNGFFSSGDEDIRLKVRRMNADELLGSAFVFRDKRLDELLFRYKARNFPECLTNEDEHQWKEYRKSRLYQKPAEDVMSPEEYDSKIENLFDLYKGDEDKLGILQALRVWKNKIFETV